MRAVPCPTIGIGARVRGAGQDAMNSSAFQGICADVDSRTHQRMAEAHPGAQLHKIGRLGGCDRMHRNSELLGGARQQRHVAERIGCRGQQ
ncbi:Uncharacterised protein [Mycobacteroides abscessus subsp. abscessus]|nr:Uncharacterised protein [Mycobacteroides abscessus subsp. abscessus]